MFLLQIVAKARSYRCV